MRFIATCLLFLSSCFHVQSHPVTGTLGRACGVSTVTCSPFLAPGDCDHVKDAVAYINATTRMQVLHWTANDVAEIVVEPTQWPVNPAQVGFTPLAVTTFQTARADGCFRTRSRRCEVFADASTMSEGARQSMFRHELLHALGMPHALWDSTSLMAPTVEMTEADPRAMTEGDLAMFRAIYTAGVL